MGASTRVSRGFHRLALFSAAIPLLVGAYLSVVYAVGEASMPPEEVWSRPALKIEGFGTVPLPPGFDSLSRDQRDELVDQIATSLRPQWWANFSKAFGVSLAILPCRSLFTALSARLVGSLAGLQHRNNF